MMMTMMTMMTSLRRGYSLSGVMRVPLFLVQSHAADGSLTADKTVPKTQALPILNFSPVDLCLVRHIPVVFVFQATAS